MKEEINDKMNQELARTSLNRAILSGLVPEIESSKLVDFSNLQNSTGEGIIEDIKAQKKTGMKAQDILARLHELIKKGQEFDYKSSSDSDRTYKPQSKATTQEMERREANEFAAGSADRLIKEMEEGESGGK